MKNAVLCIVTLVSSILILAACSPQSTAQPTGTSSTPNLQTGSDEPVLVTGTIPYTSPFFLAGNSEPFVLLEDEAGFVSRNREFVFPQEGQAIGPVWQLQDGLLRFSLDLPAWPQSTLVDLDHDNEQDQGVMIFVVAYWSNTWGGPFLEERDGTGWSNAYSSTTTDPDRDDEINGGTMIVWAPDDQQSFPSGFGEDDMLFTDDDPVTPVPAGYSFVDLSSDPFRIYKQPTLELELTEGAGQVKDYSSMSYTDAFDNLFNRVSVEYPFTDLKGINWQAIHDQIAPQIKSAKNDTDFYLALQNFAYSIPDGHVGLSPNWDVFYSEVGGSFGMVLDQLDDGSVVVKQVLPNYPAEQAGIEVGAKITNWNGKPAGQALEENVPFFSPFSTKQGRQLDQLVYLTRVPTGDSISVTFQNPGGASQTVSMTSVQEVDSLLAAYPFYQIDPLSTPVQSQVLDSGLGYIVINSFQDDYNLMARLWDRAMGQMIDNNVPGLIIDLRVNGGGSGGLAINFADYFYDEESILWQRQHYNQLQGGFETDPFPARIKPAPKYYDGPIAVLISPSCISACEGFAYSLVSTGRAIAVGYAPTAGAFGDVGFGQYHLPGGYDMQFPTGRPIDANGNVVLEGVGVQLDVKVPKTLDNLLSSQDPVLQAAVQAILAKIQ